MCAGVEFRVCLRVKKLYFRVEGCEHLTSSLLPPSPLRAQDGYTELMWAAEKKDTEAVKALINAGAATDLQNKVCPASLPLSLRLPPPLPLSLPSSLSGFLFRFHPPSFLSWSLPLSLTQDGRPAVAAGAVVHR